MKKICKGMAVFAIMAGLVCMASCASMGELFGSMLGGGSGGSGNIVVMLDGRSNKAPYDSIELRSNGKLEAQKPNSMNNVKGKWESDKNTDHVGNGDTITVTIEDKTGKGTVRQISSKWVPEKPNSDSPGNYTEITYSVNLGALGTYTFIERDFGK